ncbi:MAG: hypothetical protein CVU39_00555 [Chloroflexi bacterium HGW-Chloroflexi-10]|nr:MAG: hypothetical protein CVU39_00555 [Chloroflexi bacterium HGW-Chloroflexi-10]
MKESKSFYKPDFRYAYLLSIVVAVLFTGASLAGLLFRTDIYLTQEAQRAFVSNDLVNLFLGLPVLLVAMWFTRQGKLSGQLFWPGALFFITYNAIAYSIGNVFSWLTFIYLAQVLLSIIAIILILSQLFFPQIGEHLRGKVKERLCGAVLVGLGSLFFIRSAAQLVGTFSGQATLSQPELGVLLADLLTTPFWVAGGILLWRKHALGYAGGAGLLFQSSMLFVGLLVFFLLQPLVAGVPFPLEDFVVIAVMGLVCFIPFGLFVRGILHRSI